ncbi:MAG: DNA gyrase/topoisomerase IV subunit A [Marinifilaceae bacterium]
MSEDKTFEDLDPKENNIVNNESTDSDVEQKEEMRNITHLSGMYQNWFLDYASYVILERAVPYINDGLKPVQRRILHAMKGLDDGRYNKVANIIGFTMQFHPHGDASIGDALVQLGQKELLIDCQGNWGNILTGDSAAAPRYIEARLSKFALDVVFNQKTTTWQSSYDGRNKEPITLPVKFPLLLAQGVEGIAVGLASKILPHNFIELIDASISYLKEKPFEIFPDFPTGGMLDISRYNDGLRGGNIKVRARIEKENSKTLKITEVPYGRTTSSLIESILRANDKGKIKIKKVDDNTAADVEILIHLSAGVSSDTTIDALYAFTDCELSISPNACIVEGDKPRFVTVSEILRHSTDAALDLSRKELIIRLNELEDEWHNISLEKIFIEERIYKDKDFENSKTIDDAIKHVGRRLKPFTRSLLREIGEDDVKHLLEIKMRRILKFNSEKSNEYLLNIESDIDEVKNHIDNIVDYTINYFKQIRKKYSAGKERKTELRSFDSIVASKVIVKNEKLYFNKEEGFVGTSLKKDQYICDCSDLDDIIVFNKSGSYMVTKIADKLFVGKDVIYVNVFRKNDKRTIYNIAYRDGKAGNSYVKRFNVSSITRDKHYDVSMGNKLSKILYFSANPNGEAEVINVNLKQKSDIKKKLIEYDFAKLSIKGRASMGNLLTKAEIHKVNLKNKGVSTLGGRKIWFDKDILRLNNMCNGDFLGEFSGEDKILVVTKNGEYYNTDFDLGNHYEDDIYIIEKFDPHKEWSCIFYDADQKFLYLKRFCFDESSKSQKYIGDNPASYFVIISDSKTATFEITYGGKHKDRFADEVIATDFIAVKSYKARGKRLTTLDIASVKEIEVKVNEE